MQINIIWDSSTSTAPAAFTAAVNYVVQTFDALITNPITVNIAVGWGEVDGTKLSSGALGESETNGDNYTYSQVRTALLANATSADDLSATSFLPVSSPVAASAPFFLASAQEKALGLLPANGTEIDGWLGISKTANFDYSPTGTVPSGQYYLVGVIEHELTEDLGRISGLSASSGYTIMDLFRYSAPGVRNVTMSTRTPAYFSVNNGTTDLGDYNIVAGGDFGDWAADMAPDSFLAFSSSGTLNGLSQSDIRLMDVLGFTVSGSSTPPPVTYSLSPNPASVNENAGTLTLTVTRSSGTSAGTVFVSTVADQGFANSGNYAALSAQAVNFTAGQTSALVSVSINDLGLTSGSENYRVVVLQNATDPTTAAVASDVFTIANNDSATPVTYSLSPNPASVNENAGTLTLTVTRSSTTSTGTVYLSTVADQGFTNSGNYTNLTAQAVNFTAGQSTANVSIAINDLGLTSGSENYRAVVLPTATSPTTAAVASDVFTIVNNDVVQPPPVGFSLTPNPATVNENGKSLTLTLTRANTSSLQIFFASTLNNQGSANNGNYNALTNQPIIFGKGQATVSIAIPINDLGLTSGSETYGVIVTPTASGSPTSAVATDTFTIVNNDGGGPSVTYSLSPNPASVNENAGTLTLTVTRSSATSAGTVFVSTVADQGSANSGNYTSLNAQAVAFTAGQSTANVSIAINDLGLTSGSENYRAVVLPTSTSPTTAAVASDVFTIVNNDTPPVTYSLSPNPASVNENADTLTLTVTRSSATSAGTVFVSTVADQGSANSGNYTNLNAQAVAFSAGQSTANVSIAINDLGLTSGSENYRAVVLPTSTSPTTAAVASDVFTIVNNDTPPPVPYSLSPNPASADENEGTLTLTVTRSSATSAGTVFVSTVADQGFANSGNYTALNAQAVAFSAGQSTANVSITINDLGLTSGSESYRAVVLPTSTSPTTAAVASDVFTIMNDDPAITYSLSPNPASVNENAGTLTLTVTRSTASAAGTVYLSTVADQGTANNGYYTNLSAQAVSFAAAQTTANVSISINDLGLTSGSENFRAVVLPTASSPTSAAVASDVFTIVNNDTPPPVTYSLSPNPASVNENAGTLTLTVTRSSAASAGTVFVSTVADQGSANSGNYSALNAQTVTFSAGQSTANVSITINDLGLTTGSENYRAVVLPTSTSPTTAAVASDVFTIVNNDTPPPPVTYSLSPNPASVNENAGTLTLTVTRSSATSAGTVFVSTVADQGSANSGNYTNLTGQAVAFAAGQSTANVSIAINDLGLTSGSENYRAVVLPTSTSPTTAAVASDVFTIVNNDVVQPPPTGYTFAPSPATVNENAKTLTLTLTRASTSSLQIFYANTLTDQGSANNGNFTALTNLPIVFGFGQATYTISIPIKDLGLTSGSETYRVVVTPTVSGSPTTAIATDTFTIVNNDTVGHSVSQSSSNSLPNLSAHAHGRALFGSGLGGLAGTHSSLIGLNNELLRRTPTHFAAGT